MKLRSLQCLVLLLLLPLDAKLALSLNFVCLVRLAPIAVNRVHLVLPLLLLGPVVKPKSPASAALNRNRLIPPLPPVYVVVVLKTIQPASVALILLVPPLQLPVLVVKTLIPAAVMVN
jgi:hypothetical protein